MKERGIIFSGAMVRAILAGTKTQTRRVLTLPKGAELDGITKNECPPIEVFCSRPNQPTGTIRFGCPYGVSGDCLWVRESYCPFYFGDNHGYRADFDAERLRGVVPEPRWTPSIYMPRADSRITLEIADVRVERLLSISEDDARAEGIAPLPLQEGEPGCWWTADPASGSGLHARSASAAFAKLWDSINGRKAPWSSNPWVWALTFRRVDDVAPAGAEARG